MVQGKGIKEPPRVTACPFVNNIYPLRVREDDEFHGKICKDRKNVLKKVSSMYKQA